MTGTHLSKQLPGGLVECTPFSGSSYWLEVIYTRRGLDLVMAWAPITSLKKTSGFFFHPFLSEDSNTPVIVLLFSCSVMSDSLWPNGLQHTRLPWLSSSPRACSNSSPSSQWCHPTISSSLNPFSFCLQSFPASGPFPMSQLFISGSQSIGASASVLPVNIQDWSPLGWTGWISLQSKGLPRVFSNITVQKNQFFGTKLSLWSNSHIYTWLMEKP